MQISNKEWYNSGEINSILNIINKPFGSIYKKLLVAWRAEKKQTEHMTNAIDVGQIG